MRGSRRRRPGLQGPVFGLLIAGMTTPIRPADVVRARSLCVDISAPRQAVLVENHRCKLQRAVRARCGVRLKRRGAQGSWPASAASLVNTPGASCLSVANAVSEASYAPGHGPEHRRAAGAKRRPLHPHAALHPDSPLPPRNFACPSIHRVSATGRDYHFKVDAGSGQPIGLELNGWSSRR